jgi:hypothetical protein
MKVFVSTVKPAMRMVRLSKADAGEHSVYLLMSARFSRNGVPPRGGLKFGEVCRHIPDISA